MNARKRCIALLIIIMHFINLNSPLVVNAEVTTPGTSVLYRYRDKEFTTSEQALDDPWVLYDQEQMIQHGETFDVYLDENESIDENVYCVHAKIPTCKYHHQTLSKIIYVSSSLTDHEYYYSNGSDQPKLYWHYGDCYCYHVCAQSSKTTVTKYYYYKWSEWSEWSTTEVIATEDREVEIRTQYCISYDANGGSNAPSAQTKIQNEDLILSTSVPTRDGYTFTGWSTTSDGEVEYTAGATYALNESATLYAVWRADTYTISYDANGGTNAPEAQTKAHSFDLVLSAQQPVRPGYKFLGWSSTMDGKVEYCPADNYVQNASVVLYAIWEVQPEVEFSWKLSNAGVLTIQGTCAMPDWEAGGAPWYSKRYTIKKIIIEEGITNIGNYAFQDCTMVSSIIIPSTVRAIGVSSFSSCNSLKSITIPDSVCLIGDSAFEWCNALTRVTLGAGLVSIGSKAYTHCVQLSDIKFPESLKTIGDFAFEACSSLSQITIPNSVKSIGVATFMDCTNLMSVTLSENMTSIPEHAFAYCSNLLTINIPDSVTAIDMYAFYSCTRMTEAILGSRVESIGSYAFCGCEGLMEICIPKSTEILYENCFNSCFNLNSLTIFSGLTLIDAGAFRYCNALETVFYYGSESQWYTTTINTDNDPLFDATVVFRHLYFSGAALILHDNLAVNYKVDKTLFETIGYADPYIIFEFNGMQTKVDSYTIDGDKYVFSFTNIAPNQMTDTIYATLYASFDGMEFSSETKEYSVATYCYNMLEKYQGDEYAELRTLLVDLLNYGAAAQVYTGCDQENLVNSQLTDKEAAWGTSTDRPYNSVLNPAYRTIDDPSVAMKGAGLNLQDSVTMRLKFEADSIDGLILKVESASGNWLITSDTFVKTSNYYYAFFNGLDAAHMSETVFFTFYQGNKPISNTARYSIESYAYSNQGNEDQALANLVKAMMRYGDSAFEYIN